VNYLWLVLLVELLEVRVDDPLWLLVWRVPLLCVELELRELLWVEVLVLRLPVL